MTAPAERPAHWNPSCLYWTNGIVCCGECYNSHGLCVDQTCEKCHLNPSPEGQDLCPCRECQNHRSPPPPPKPPRVRCGSFCPGSPHDPDCPRLAWLLREDLVEAGQMRASGVPIPKEIPDDATIRRSEMFVEIGERHRIDEHGRLLLATRIYFTGSFVRRLLEGTDGEWTLDAIDAPARARFRP